MKRVRIIYIGILLIAVFLVSTVFFSYAFLTSINEEHGKLNIVAGTLDYKIESNDLKNNKITVQANEIKEIDIKLTSLNDIDSKYEMFYTLDKTNNNVRVGYSKDTIDGISGTIKANSTNNINIVIRNESNTDSTITFDVIGGLKNNELVLKEGNSLNQVVGIYNAYNIGDEITLTDGSKWHVLEASNDTEENIVLLSDYNLNSDGSYNDSCQGTKNDIETDNGVKFKCSPMAFDIDNTNVYDENDSNNIGYFIKNIYEPLVTASLTGTTNVTLPTANQIARADSKTFSGYYIRVESFWLLTTSYWTKTSVSTVQNNVWHIYPGDYSGIGNFDANSSVHYGARPTITTPKSNIVDTMSSTTPLAIGTSVTAIDGSKWHVLEASSSDSKYVTLLSDYNLNSDGTYNTECGRDINSTYICSSMAFDADNTNLYDGNDSNNIGYFIKNIYAPKVTSSLHETTNVTLPTAAQISSADNKIFEGKNIVINGLWLLTTNYWTKTYSDQWVWYIAGDVKSINYTSPDNKVYFGARPVITTLKTNLLTQ